MFISPEVEMDNPINYTILNKGQFKIGPSSMSTGRQNPQMKYLRNKNDIVFEGKPVDSTDEQLERITTLAEYVHELSYAINITEALYNPYDNSTFLEKYIGLDNIDGLVHKKDRSHNNIFNLIRRCVYDGTSVEDIKQRIINVWLENHHEQEYLLVGFYQTLQESIPEQLKDYTKYVPETVSTYIV